MAMQDSGGALRAYVEYLRDLGIYDLYRKGEPVESEELAVEPQQAGVETVTEPALPVATVEPTPVMAAPSPIVVPVVVPSVPAAQTPESSIPKLVSFNDLSPLPEQTLAAAARPAALQAIQEEIGDCTRCPLAYADLLLN